MYAFKTNFFLKERELGGLGFTKENIGDWHKYAIIPAFFILFLQPKFVPSKISNQNFIAFCLILFTIFLIIIPVFTAWYQASGIEFVRSFMLFDFMCISLFTAKLFTPAMNILLNLYLEKSKRAALNSIFFFGSSFLVMIFNELVPYYVSMFYDDIIMPMSEWSKVWVMVPFLTCQAICIVCILTAGLDKKIPSK